MKRIAALLAVVMFTTFLGGVATAQDSYPPSPAPSHAGLDADGSLALDFSNTEFAPGSQVTITDKAGQALAVGTIGADGLLVIPNAQGLAGQSVVLQGVRGDGGPITTGVKFIPDVAPTPVPTTSDAPPVHDGVADDGSLMLDFGPTDFAPGSKVIVNDTAGNALASITVGADGKVVIADATGIAGQSLQFVGVNDAGVAVTSALKFLAAAPVDPAAPTSVAPPVHDGLGADGSLTLDFGPTDFAPGTKVVVNDTAGNALASIVVGANGTVVIPDATGIAGQSLQFVGVDDAGAAVTSALKFLAAPSTVVQVPVPVPVPVPVVAQPAPAPIVTGPLGSFDPKLAVTPKSIIEQAQAAPAPAPAAKSPAVPLAVTGGNAQIPVMIGSALILAGGLAILGSRKRAEAI